MQLNSWVYLVVADVDVGQPTSPSRYEELSVELTQSPVIVGVNFPGMYSVLI